MGPPGLGSLRCPLGLGSAVEPLRGVSGVRWPPAGSVSCGVRLGPSSRVFGRLVCSPLALGGLAALASSSSSVEWLGTFRHQPCDFLVSVCRRLYSRFSPSPLRASSRAFFALRSPSGSGSRSLVLPPALACAMPRILNISPFCSAFLAVYMCISKYHFAVPPGCIDVLG